MHIHEATGQDDATPEERHAARRAELAAALAEELDLDTDTVAAAIERVHERHRAEHRAALQERLDAAAEAGALTREQADAILAAQAAGVLGSLGPRGHHGPPVGSWGVHVTRARDGTSLTFPVSRSQL